ncbi:Rdx family-domain-containing protein [Scheffersomyces xylosifermentans]|uniref:Rdx family-domain-containing protein n=1 Tax=Scheffersomyces xylosifermentans TaxID=1304137 RepID=UPI00315D8CDB
MTIPSTKRYPKVIIQYCAKCKWQNRAIWYVQELLQTFPEVLHDISIQPIYDQPGIFAIVVQIDDLTEQQIVYKRRFKSAELAMKYGDKDGLQREEYYYDGFPDAKFVKILIRNSLEAANGGVGEVKLGHHVDRDAGSNFLTSGGKEKSGKEVDEGVDEKGGKSRKEVDTKQNIEDLDPLDCKECKIES